ncbi:MULTISPECIES: Fe-S cluster assembly protein SufD [Bartonella]|uniref:Fe-S cluster assembly protein SufD n=1 Tax=Bartonella TaxID=773 RepID=UPI0018DD9A33|nr:MULTISPECIES: Fe-S cluster assembly protein SufD [Bartonella]MBH9994458.1 Fe-S cluster assembly protein SufD [Bartonella sp. P0291]MBH9997197.1 Fe-S cluster assembly protein SufD [Bartonella sp. M0192]MBH9999357.1 Fe-S cluster assembly protein SufD [Bartonella sp. M0191]MBI0007161.1 Fe-S cluster assembly protein SufD [Bartonella sp. M0193]MBI0010648.1 Fe-S cluster assembly protein SufD [Bartonella sp. M0176]
MSETSKVDKKPEMTAAEQAIVDIFGQKLGDFPGNSEVMSTRDSVVEQFKHVGIPSRKREYWHYTDLRTLLKTIPNFSDEGDGLSRDPLLPKDSVFAIFNGKTLDAPQVQSITTKRVADELANEHFTLKPDISDDDFVGQVNTAFVTDGWLLEVAEGAKIADPVELQMINPGGQAHAYSQIKVGNNSSVTFIERQLGGEKSTFVTSVQDLKIGEGADVTWIIIRDRGFDATQFSKFLANLDKKAKLTLYIVNIASELNRQEIDIEMPGEGGNFQLRTINLLAGASHSDVTMFVRHIGEDTVSTEIVRNVVADKARGAFQGMIKVSREAQKTDARMTCNSLILSDDAEFDSKPELEIFADDVACGHGSTVAEIDREQLFYLMARGIEESVARGLLVKAFVSQLIDDVENDQMKDVIVALINQWLEKHL